jgi:hypothetical protein
MGMYVYSLTARTDETICTRLGMLISCDRKDFYKDQAWKVFWVQVPLRAVPASVKLSKTKTATRAELFDTKRRLQKQRRMCRKPVLRSSPVKVVSVARQLSTVEEWRQYQTCFGEITGTKAITTKKCPGFESRLNVFLARKLRMLKEQCRDQRKGIRGTKATSPQNCPGFESRWKMDFVPGKFMAVEQHG